MEITEVDEIKSYEMVDKEPFHYVAAIKQTYGWTFTSYYPCTNKEALIDNIRNCWKDVTEVRIYKMRLPIG